MAIGGRDIGTWDNTTPAAGDDSGLGDDHFRSVKTSIQTAIDAEHEFSTVGGANTGRHRPGSAMAYFDVESNVSAGDVGGRLFLTSNTTRLFALGTSSSSASLFIGSTKVIEHAVTTSTTNAIWIEDSGVDAVFGGPIAQQFAVDYDSVPVVTLSALSTSAGGSVFANLSAVTVGGFTGSLRYIDESNAGAGGSGDIDRPTDGSVHWRSIGTRSL